MKLDLRISAPSLFLTLLALSSCTGGDPSGPGPGRDSDKDAGTPGTEPYEMSFGDFQVIRQRLDGAFPMLLEMAVAVVRNSDSLAVSVGGMSLNGDPLEEFEVQGMIGYRGMYGIHDEMPVRYDGGHAVFTIGDNPVVGRFADSVPTPRGDLELMSPRRGEALSRSSGIRLRWTPAGLDSLYLMISSDSTYNDIRLTTPDDGEFYVGPDRLEKIPQGEISISLLGLRMKEGRFASGRRYVLSASTSVHLTTTLGR